MKKVKKILLRIAAAIAALILAVLIYVGIGRHRMDKLLHEHLSAQGYTDADISRYTISHSFLNRILSYPEWRIEVVFADEPDVVYEYGYWNGDVSQGSAHSDRIREKEDLFTLKHYEH